MPSPRPHAHLVEYDTRSCIKGKLRSVPAHPFYAPAKENGQRSIEKFKEALARRPLTPLYQSIFAGSIRRGAARQGRRHGRNNIRARLTVLRFLLRQYTLGATPPTSL